MMTRVKDILLFIGIITIILLLVFKKEAEPVYPVQQIKAIETIIEGKETIVHENTVQIVQETKLIKELSNQIELLRFDLDQVKETKDTFQIVQIQDTIINVLTDENKHLNTVVNLQDSTIVAQRYIINSKDTIIAIQDNKLTKVKRQRNISLLFNGLLAGVSIFKK